MSVKILKRSLSIALVVLAAVFFVSCTSSKTETSTGSNSSDMVKVTDKNGEVNVKKNPRNVVTFDYGALDILDVMGIDVAGLPKGSLPSRFSKYQDSKYTDLGGLKDPDFETINSLKPELIIISGRQADLYDKFKEIAPTILLSLDGSDYINDFKKNVETLVTIFGSKDSLTQRLADIDSKVKEINSFATENNINVLTLFVNEGSLSTFSVGSRYGLIYNELGFKPVDDKIESSTHGQQISFEYVVDKNPDYIFVIDRGIAIGGEGTAKSLLDNDLIKSTDAYKNDNILYLDSQIWYTVAGGVNSTYDMLNEVSDFIGK